MLNAAVMWRLRGCVGSFSQGACRSELCACVGVLMCLGMIPNTDGYVKISVVCRNYVLYTNLRLISRSIFFFFFQHTHTHADCRPFIFYDHVHARVSGLTVNV